MSGIYSIREIAELIAPIAERYGVVSVRLFGSYAKGHATENSDVDLLIDGGKIRGLFQLTAFRLDCEDALGKSVDVVTVSAQDQDFIRRIRNDEVTLYDVA